MNPRALPPALERPGSPAAAAIMRLSHRVTDAGASQERGASLPVPLLPAANMKPNQTAHNTTDDKTQRKENVRGQKWPQKPP